jgi:RNA polymerase sigma factor (TIGR02999 family)
MRKTIITAGEFFFHSSQQNLKERSLEDASQLEITLLLRAWGNGDQHALERLTPAVYDELRRLAQWHLRREGPDHSLQATALVHEAYLKLVDAQVAEWHDRAHFFAIAARLMRRILVDAARTRQAEKRGGDAARIEFDEAVHGVPVRSDELMRLDEALEAMAQFDERKAKVVELRFFGGLTVAETAEVLKISEQSVLRDWRLARSWLARELDAG